ncbi:Cro/Cl family transcriptional regulator [Xenorhabdus bovienii]|uniref:Cro/CI family transcriptional regulator n=1 Tax=Xenorhabdus bovienii TaxID=40576 RepID=UPI0023B24FD6|nr:Cro/CI family transcriptional regulator [Xenorhabdus bovienii]MDE9455278.1 Cro/Cl family transcriptional regulator [Xenorhabdus bovienii]MDE9553676.1 Cro/Cl family transcriptional regulator [Xenorhabdus bovienii]MDE9556715.1 Cro/Cl family transcriptional regulator [Xenorhabdus bovienii]MDE9566415.1 Cro/Cl family transcriptional regulator [Xenorhabdus bovienii]
MTVNEIVCHFGTIKKTAKFYGVTPEAVSMWKRRAGGLIPKSRALEAELRTNGKLKYRADLYEKVQIQVNKRVVEN